MMIQTVLLAAGSSSRMGEVKPLLPYQGESLVIHALRAALQASDRVVVVTGFYAERIEEVLKPYQEAYPCNLSIIRNPHPEAGQFSSTLCGVRALDPDQTFAITMATSIGPPLGTTQTPASARRIEAVRPFCNKVPATRSCAQRSEADRTRPTGHRDHAGASRGSKVCILEDDVRLDTDIDTPEAYQRLICFSQSTARPSHPC